LLGDLPRIELFARQQVTGWDCWGDEIPEIKKLKAIS
jgi:N6-adenosine-specific RNA methylase IME4